MDQWECVMGTMWQLPITYCFLVDCKPYTIWWVIENLRLLTENAGKRSLRRLVISGLRSLSRSIFASTNLLLEEGCIQILTPRSYDKPLIIYSILIYNYFYLMGSNYRKWPPLRSHWVGSRGGQHAINIS